MADLRRCLRLLARYFVRSFFDMAEGFGWIEAWFVSPRPASPVERRLRSWSHDPR